MSSVNQLPSFFNLQFKSITDILPLLRSEEESVLYQVISQLVSNTKKDIDLCQTLSSNANLVSLLCNIFLAHLDSNISMESVRLIRNLIQNVPAIKDKEIWETVVSDCANNLFMSESNAIQKSPTVLLSILTQETRHAVQFAKKDVNFALFVDEGFTNADTELQHAVVQIMRNVILGVQADKKVEFDMDTIDVGNLIELYQSDYPVIAKTALELTQLLLCRYSDTHFKSSKVSLNKSNKARCNQDVGHRCGRHKYRKSRNKISTHLGLGFLEKFIEKEGWDILTQLLNATKSEDIHSSVFDVLSCLICFPSTSILITESLVDFLITYVNTCTENELCFDAMSLIVKIAETPSRDIKELLSQNESLADLILESIQDEDCCFVGEGCSLIAFLIMEDPIFDKVSQEVDNVLSILCCIVNSKDKKCSWYIRVKAVSALSSMVLCDGEMCAKFVDLNKTANLVKWLTPDETSEDMVSELLYLHYLAYNKPTYLNELPIEMFHELSSGALLQMKSTNAEIQKKAARLYSALFERMWDLQSELDSYEILHNLLVNAPDGSNAQQLFAQNIIIPLQFKYSLAPQHNYHKRQVVTHGTLHWLVQQSKIRHLPPILKELRDLIFEHHVSAKFAYCNEVPAKYNINDIRNEIPTSFYFYRNQRDYSEQRFRLLDELKEELKNKSLYTESKNKSSETDNNKISEVEQCKNKSSESDKNKTSEEDHSKTTEEDKSQNEDLEADNNKSLEVDQSNNKTSKAEQSYSQVNQNRLDSGDLIYVLHSDWDTVFYNELFCFASPHHPCPSRSAGLSLCNESDFVQNVSDQSGPESAYTPVEFSKTTEEKFKIDLNESLLSSKTQLNKSEDDPSQTCFSDIFDGPIRAYTVCSSNDSPVSNSWWWCTGSNSYYSNGSISSNRVPRFSDLTTYADIVLRTFSSTNCWTCHKENVYPSPSFHLYLCELIIRLNTNMVPFESLCFGRELECAVLFKCLCDRGIPNGRISCSLHRGSKLREAWVQVYILDSTTDWYMVKFERDQAQICLNQTGLERNKCLN